MMKHKIKVRSDFIFYLCFCLLLLPIRWVASWIIAAAVHEAFHLMAVYLLGGNVKSVCIGVGGAQICAQVQGKVKNLICILAGPIGGLSLLIVSDVFPSVSVCAFLQSIFNLLPIYPLDGGKVLSCILEDFCGVQRPETVLNAVFGILVILMICVCLYAAFVWELGLLPLTACLLFALRQVKRKKSLQRKRTTGTIGIPETEEVCYDRITAKSVHHCTKARPLYRR